MKSTRKPHNDIAGYVAERKARLGGYIVIYDRDGGFELDASERWIVMHEPSSRHVAVRTLATARGLMKVLAEAQTVAEADRHADVFPQRD